MVAGFRDFFATSAGASAAFIGLLFVSLSVAAGPRRRPDLPSDAVHPGSALRERSGSRVGDHVDQAGGRRSLGGAG